MLGSDNSNERDRLLQGTMRFRKNLANFCSDWVSVHGAWPALGQLKRCFITFPLKKSSLIIKTALWAYTLSPFVSVMNNEETNCQKRTELTR